MTGTRIDKQAFEAGTGILDKQKSPPRSLVLDKRPVWSIDLIEFATKRVGFDEAGAERKLLLLLSLIGGIQPGRRGSTWHA